VTAWPPPGSVRFQAGNRVRQSMGEPIGRDDP
jgi:hypothetical protein